jgi:hypothetical protein
MDLDMGNPGRAPAVKGSPAASVAPLEFGTPPADGLRTGRG